MRALVLFLMVAACNTAGPHFRGLPATRVTVAGAVFDVRQRDTLAEAIRVNPQYAPRLGPIRARAARAMAEVTGCTVTKVTGDQAQLLGTLSCDGLPARRPVALPLDLTCVPLRGTELEVLGSVTVEIECEPTL